MNRLTAAWFEFKGIRSDNMGIMLAEMPQRAVAARNMTRKKVSSRNGRIRRSDNSYDDITLQQRFDARDESRLREIDAWLTGSGLLRFSDDPDLVYDACIEASPTRQSIRPRFGGQRYTVKFVCAPFRMPYAVQPDVTITNSGGTFTNPGTAPTPARIRITGKGDFNVTIGFGASGSTTMFFDGVTWASGASAGGIIVDSEVGDVFTYDGTLLDNDKATGDLFILPPGVNTVSWQATGSGNSVSKVEILAPKWRYF